MAGYNEMLRRIEPEKIICYNTPFPEMQGDIIYVDYEMSSWKYMNYERKVADEDISADKIGGYAPDICDTMSSYMVSAGGGSAYGGDWQPSPNKPEDQRFLGEPGTIKTTYKNGYRRDTKIGKNGRAVKERHYTTYPNPKYHTDPHDHKITWDDRGPHLGPAINYPDGATEFKNYRSFYSMKNTIVPANTSEQNHFETISDFKWCLRLGGEVIFTWNCLSYGIFGDGKRYCIAEADGENERWCDTADEVLEYMVGSDRLRDVITQVTVLDRTI